MKNLDDTGEVIILVIQLAEIMFSERKDEVRIAWISAIAEYVSQILVAARTKRMASVGNA